MFQAGKSTRPELRSNFSLTTSRLSRTMRRTWQRRCQKLERPSERSHHGPDAKPERAAPVIRRDQLRFHTSKELIYDLLTPASSTVASFLIIHALASIPALRLHHVAPPSILWVHELRLTPVTIETPPATAPPAATTPPTTPPTAPARRALLAVLDVTLALIFTAGVTCRKVDGMLNIQRKGGLESVKRRRSPPAKAAAARVLPSSSFRPLPSV